MTIFLDLHCHCVEMLYWWVWIRYICNICTWYAVYNGCMLLYLNAQRNWKWEQNKSEQLASVGRLTGSSPRSDGALTALPLVLCLCPLHAMLPSHLREVSFLCKSSSFFCLISPLMQNSPLLAWVWSASFTRAQGQGLGCCHKKCWLLIQQIVLQLLGRSPSSQQAAEQSFCFSMCFIIQCILQMLLFCHLSNVFVSSWNGLWQHHLDLF